MICDCYLEPTIQKLRAGESIRCTSMFDVGEGDNNYEYRAINKDQLLEEALSKLP